MEETQEIRAEDVEEFAAEVIAKIAPEAPITAEQLAAAAVDTVKKHPRHEHEGFHAWLTRTGQTHLIIPAPEKLEGETFRQYHKRTGCPHPESIHGEPHHEFLARTKRVHVQGESGETLDQLIKRAKKVKHHDVHVDGELKALACCSPKHAERKTIKDEHDYRDHVTVFDGHRASLVKCNRCAHHDRLEEEEALLKDKQALREKVKAALNIDDAALDALMALKALG